MVDYVTSQILVNWKGRRREICSSSCLKLVLQEILVTREENWTHRINCPMNASLHPLPFRKVLTQFVLFYPFPFHPPLLLKKFFIVKFFTWKKICIFKSDKISVGLYAYKIFNLMSNRDRNILSLGFFFRFIILSIDSMTSTLKSLLLRNSIRTSVSLSFHELRGRCEFTFPKRNKKREV